MRETNYGSRNIGYDDIVSISCCSYWIIFIFYQSEKSHRPNQTSFKIRKSNGSYLSSSSNTVRSCLPRVIGRLIPTNLTFPLPNHREIRLKLGTLHTKDIAEKCIENLSFRSGPSLRVFPIKKKSSISKKSKHHCNIPVLVPTSQS